MSPPVAERLLPGPSAHHAVSVALHALLLAHLLGARGASATPVVAQGAAALARDPGSVRALNSLAVVQLRRGEVPAALGRQVAPGGGRPG